MKYLKKTDPEIARLIKLEEKRQEETLMMIPSENYASEAVMEALGTRLTNKYSEGYSNARYYQGNKIIDQVETLCIERAKKLFNVPYVNVQPYSGSPANTAVFFALLEPGDKITGLSLPSGGHLTHGVPKVTFSGKYFNSVQYDVAKNGWIDYDQLEKFVLKEKPKLIVAGTTHYPRKLDFKRFAKIAEKVNAFLMADISHVVGMVIAGVYPDPVPHAHVVTTTTHKTLRGPRGAIILVTNKGLRRDPDMGKKINSAIIPGLQGGPHNNVTAALAVAFKEASKKSFTHYNEQIVKNAKVLANDLVKKGYDLQSGGTDTHVMVIDLRKQKILGNTAAEALEEAGIVLNRNKVPFDTNPPFYPSGIRMGTPGLTSRGMKEKEMKLIASWIDEVLKGISITKKGLNLDISKERKRSIREQIVYSTKVLKKINQEVKKLCKRFPVRRAY
ncbi:serine hydroxymethyltransferase [Candidatus Roizmanbacteria bacterium]|nr:serine hydroxymethyltransferase [Candidatus Roizmanbacteria bacterium]